VNRDNRSALGALDRRALLRSGLGAVGLASVGVPLLDACGSSASGGGTTKSGGAAGGGGAPAAAAGGAVNDYGPLAYRLPGVENVEFAGVYVADNKGYYKAEGFSSLSLFPGGPAASSVEGDVVSKKADLAVGSLDVVAAAIVQGAPLKIVGAQYQKNPFAITSMADKAINAPEDMYGKKIGVQAADEAVWNGFLAAAKLDASKITKVAVQADPTPLTQGAVDGWFSLCTDEPVALGTKGFKVATMMLADHGYPMVSQVYILHTDSIAQSRGTIKSFLRGEIKGWTASLVDPGLGASLAAGSYGKSLGLAVDEQTSQSKAQNKLILTADTKANGLFTVTDALVAQSVATLKASGLDITADKLFDLSMLKEVYQEDPALVSALPAVPAA
jgi:ABC-type nitrate/sulfonate/bicarbonate transport system substrate-binding protein